MDVRLEIGNIFYKAKLIRHNIGQLAGSERFTIILECNGLKKIHGGKQNLFIPERVIFNPPATIAFWPDGTKTVVKTSGEDFDPEKGLAMATIRKIYKSRNALLKVLEKGN